MKELVLAVVVTTTLFGAAAQAQSATHTDWPCVQRKVSEISLAAVWSGPEIPAAAENWRANPQVHDLVEKIAARRTTIEEAKQLISDLAASNSARSAEVLPSVMAGLIEVLNKERGEVISGIERYARRQKELADKIRAENSKLDQERAKVGTDTDDITKRDEQLLWDTRIFEDRQRSLASVCEVPVLIDQRLYSLAHLIQRALK